MSKKVVIKLVGGAEGMEKHPELMEQLGRYLLKYEPENAKYGLQWIWTTDNPEQALQMDSIDAFTLISTSVGTRLDGNPDRPIRAFDLQVESLSPPAEDEHDQSDHSKNLDDSHQVH